MNIMSKFLYFKFSTHLITNTLLHFSNGITRTDSGDHSTGDIVNEPKHCWNMDVSTFNIHNEHFQSDWNR